MYNGCITDLLCKTHWIPLDGPRRSLKVTGTVFCSPQRNYLSTTYSEGDMGLRKIAEVKPTQASNY